MSAAIIVGIVMWPCRDEQVLARCYANDRESCGEKYGNSFFLKSEIGKSIKGRNFFFF